MTEPPPIDPSDEARREPRNNLYVAAKIASPQACGPICIRNLSSSGALIEGGSMPPEGARVRVSRGSLSATGTIAWRDGSRAGVRFDSAISIGAWLPGGTRTQQQRIDEAVHAYKTGAPSLPHLAAAPDPNADVAAELRDLEQKLRAIAEEFATDVLVCERHLSAIQVIDIATTRLAELAARID